MSRAKAVSLIFAAACAGCGERSPTPSPPAPAVSKAVSFDEVCSKADGTTSDDAANAWKERVVVGEWEFDIDRYISLFESELVRRWREHVAELPPRARGRAEADKSDWMRRERAGLRSEIETEMKLGEYRLHFKSDHTLMMSAQGRVWDCEWRACRGTIQIIRRTCQGVPVEASRAGPNEFFIPPVGDGEAGSLDIGTEIPLTFTRARK